MNGGSTPVVPEQLAYMAQPSLDAPPRVTLPAPPAPTPVITLPDKPEATEAPVDVDKAWEVEEKRRATQRAADKLEGPKKPRIRESRFNVQPAPQQAAVQTSQGKDVLKLVAIIAAIVLVCAIIALLAVLA